MLRSCPTQTGHTVELRSWGNKIITGPACHSSAASVVSVNREESGDIPSPGYYALLMLLDTSRQGINPLTTSFDKNILLASEISQGDARYQSRIFFPLLCFVNVLRCCSVLPRRSSSRGPFPSGELAVAVHSFQLTGNSAV